MWTPLVAAMPAILRGVPPWQLETYQSHLKKATTDYFQCVSMSEYEDWRMPNGSRYAARLNDDVCDCQDGSDEPGTSACAGQLADMPVDLLLHQMYIPFPFVDSTGEDIAATETDLLDKIKSDKITPGFFCPQISHIPRLIPHWRVNDFICDCCDGADEYSSEGACPNTCEAEKKVHKERETRLSKEISELTRKRQSLIEEGNAQWAEWEGRLAAAPSEMKKLDDQLRLLMEEAEQTTLSAEQETEPLEKVEDEGDAQVDKQKISEYAKWMDQGNETETSAQQTWWRRLAQKVTHLITNRWARPEIKTSELPSTNASVNNARSETDNLRAEIRQWEQSMKTAEAAMANEFLKQHHEYIHLLDAYHSYTIGEKRTELRNMEISQSEGWHGMRRNLGKLAEVIEVSPRTAKIRPSRMHAALGHIGIKLVGGDSCGANTTLWLVCGAQEKLALMEEAQPCVHVGIFVSPLGCVSREAEAFLDSAAPRRKRMAGTQSDRHSGDEL